MYALIYSCVHKWVASTTVKVYLEEWLRKWDLNDVIRFFVMRIDFFVIRIDLLLNLDLHSYELVPRTTVCVLESRRMLCRRCNFEVERPQTRPTVPVVPAVRIFDFCDGVLATQR